MRIAISGSHSLGKSTVVNDWVAAHAGYRREEEPYRALGLHGPYEILFRDTSKRLLEDAQAAGGHTADGLSMLLHQGALSLEI